MSVGLLHTQGLRALLTVLVALAAALWPGRVMASEALVSDLEQRLYRVGVDEVNTYLGTPSSIHMLALRQGTAACHLHAVSLSVQLARGSGSKVVDAHREALRVAVGSCTGFVLALLSLTEVPKFCASVSTWTVSQMARELRRRIKSIEGDELLRTSPRGKACREAYVYELHNTRVGLRVGR
ncbi:MAG: hypothetical protein H7Z15_21660 [Rhizobacter sp.]|nr:hypothetical protein [Rhizobacter sp.]